ncbi:T9SS type A sorting domain-containing protein [Lewinella sp. W8]|uniref:T9SS type A sorting domain-containing protein n=1 Tax=Lewinella sp. W8 TaxID=2528208 RepID=UPI0015676F12|nr:T9SS type A sorting domain-containing protein [Lewinella sp. W8]
MHRKHYLMAFRALIFLLCLGSGFSLSAQSDCTLSGGDLSSVEGSSYIPVCLDDGDDALTDVIRTGFVGGTSQYFFTNTAGFIQEIPTSGPPFDFRGTGTGEIVIWSVSYSGTLTDANIGDNICAAGADGCFSLSNPLIVNRKAGEGCDAFCVADGGTLTLTDGGGDSQDLCIVEGSSPAIDVTLEGPIRGDSATFLITDNNGNILAIPPGAGPFDLSGAGSGTCLIWHLAYDEDLTGLAVGNNPADFDGCFSLSNPITVNREAVDGGTISLDDGSDSATICAGDGIPDPLNVNVEGSEGANAAWVITDDSLNILALPAEPPFDLDEAGGGTCLIWYLRFADGLMGAEVGANAADLAGCFDLSNPITVVRNDPDGGTISFTGMDSDTVSICAGDGVADPLDVSLEGAVGDNMAWVITDDSLNILALPDGPPFDLEGAGGGTCLIWHLSFFDLDGAAVGANAADLMGCFDLSNPLTVIREGVDGGTIALADGSDATSICAGDGVADPLDVTLDGAEGANMAWVITDDSLNILALPDGPPFDLDEAGPGTCLIWHLSFADGLEGAAVGANAADLMGCFDLSNPITVERTSAEGGMISFTGMDSDTVSICAGDGVDDPLDVTLEGAEGANMAWVITDDSLNILALPDGPPFNLEGAGGGTCLIWHLSFADGLEGAAVGANAADLMGCFDLSNPLTVIRDGVNGGTIALAGGGDVTSICAGDGEPDPLEVTLDGAEGANMVWVITDDSLNILDLPAGPPFDLENAGPGTCLIWHLSFADGLEGAGVGSNAADLMGCFDLSNPITVVRTSAEGGTISFTGMDSDTVSICAGDGVADPLDVTLEGAEGANMAWVITDDSLNILALPDGPPFDLDEAGPGTCLIWHLSFADGLQGAAVGANAGDLAGCFDLSNPLTVVRESPDGGSITFVDFETDTVTICVGDMQSDSLAVDLMDATGSNMAWVITDDSLNILDLPAGPPFDLEGAGEGTCLIWHLSFADGLQGAAVGANAADLMGCFDLSNPLTVIRDSGDSCVASGILGNIVINEVEASGMIELRNLSQRVINFNDLYLGGNGSFVRIGDLDLDCGDLLAKPGERVSVNLGTFLNPEADELALIRGEDYSDASNLFSYVAWGDGPRDGQDMAISAGLWSADINLNGPSQDLSIQRVPDAEDIMYGLSMPTPCAPNVLSVGTTDRPAVDAFSLYPNPVVGDFTLEVSGMRANDTRLHILDLNGRPLIEQRLNAADGRFRVSAADLPAGTYLLRLTNVAGISVTRFVKK